MSSAAEAGRVPRSVLVTGATGVVGGYLLPCLCGAGLAVQATSRRPRGGPRSGSRPPGRADGDAGRVRWLSLDLARDRPGSAGLEPVDCFIHAAPLWLLPRWLPPVADLGLGRLVAFGSTSRFTKRDSASARERETARRLAEAEEAVASLCGDRGIAWTIFRPTLVYGGGQIGRAHV